MPEIISFKEMVVENGVPFVAIVEQEGGYYEDAGDWVPGGSPQPENRFGVILPLSGDDLRYSESGTYSVKDRKVYTIEALNPGQKIEYKGIPYTVQNFKDFTDYTDVFIYLARWAGHEHSNN
ncbi:hypothetical protein ACS78_08180 [Priestia megaterium]|uniref:hypothetical protein n=1 Tax=Priestia megaterium TaxID=1404 RepID=UPI0006824604|nr:hypothetical protein [Priestia megaterium]KNH23920.1 hypothetical protein ACS78_08180 [Priestia megaterium]